MRPKKEGLQRPKTGKRPEKRPHEAENGVFRMGEEMI
jgi:hypothetical protein